MEGHYEKVMSEKTEYYKYDTMIPSGVPGAIVVGKEEAEK